MFSKREREFLGLLADAAANRDRGWAALLAAFPRAGYRRKLLWGLRRKVHAAAADWQLYSKAAPLRPTSGPRGAPKAELPVFDDPLLSLFVRARRAAPRSARPVRAPAGSASRHEDQA